MSESSKRHSKFLSLIFILKCVFTRGNAIDVSVCITATKIYCTCLRIFAFSTAFSSNMEVFEFACILVVKLRKKQSIKSERSFKLTTLKLAGKTVRNDVQTIG